MPTSKKEEGKIEIIDTYDGDGFWIRRTANGCPVFIPKQTSPIIQVLDVDLRDVEWIMQKRIMSREEYENKYHV